MSDTDRTPRKLAFLTEVEAIPGTSFRLSGCAFENGRKPLSPADAHSLKGVTPLAADEFPRKIRKNAAACGPDRVAQRDAGTVAVQDVAPIIVVRPAPTLQHRQDLRRQGFVPLNKINIRPGQAPGANTLADVRRLMLDVRHALDTAGDDNVGCTGLHHHSGIDDSLKARPAAAVQLISRNGFGQSRKQPR